MAEGSPRRGHRHRVKLFKMEHREVSVGAEGLVGHPGEGEWWRHALSSLCRHCCSGRLLPGFRQLSVAAANSSVPAAWLGSCGLDRDLSGSRRAWRRRVTRPGVHFQARFCLAREGFAKS
jgi:hypothetical protein